MACKEMVVAKWKYYPSISMEIQSENKNLRIAGVAANIQTQYLPLCSQL
jgi:hypothetical protein